MILCYLTLFANTGGDAVAGGGGGGIYANTG